METNNHFFYVVKCKDNSWYAGYTNDLHKRVKTHNDGKGAKYTKVRRPV
ncbi:GIY-YIG nuclease family protein, partial [Escherichia coli]|nr:GIY-YIG nuclease family protein [Escherichia coli]